MGDDFIGVALDGAGKKVDTTTETTGAGSVERQRVSVAGVGGNNVLAVDVAGKIGVNNFPATQPVSAASLPLPAGAATDAGLVTIAADIAAQAKLTDTQPVSVAALPLPSGAATDATLAARLKPADTLAGVTTVTAVTAITNALPAGTNKLGTVDIATAAATAKGTQGANGVPTQDLKDSGRTAVVLFLDAVAGITTEALATMSITKGGVAQAAATSYTVTAGKTLRISGLHTTVKNTSTVASDSRVRVRQAASGITVSSPIIIPNEAGSPAALANAAGTDDTVIPDGYEVAGGQQVAISHIESATTCTISVTAIGYEY